MTKSSTYRLAVANGAGLVLTDGTSRYLVSDWSSGTGTVFGRIRRDRAWTDYQRLPDNLRRETPAEQMTAETMDEDQGAEFGENPDPAIRARRRLMGTDGVRDDIYDMMKPFERRIATVADEARKVAADMVRVRLKRLEARFTRHRFQAVSFMFTVAGLEVTPSVKLGSYHPTNDIGTQVWNKGWNNMREYTLLQDAALFINEQQEEIAQILVAFGDRFNIDIGVVTTDEDHDAATCYGMVPANAADQSCKA